MKIALKNLARVWVGAIVIGLLSACGGANDQTGNASPSAANYSATNLPSFLPTTQTPPSAQTIAIQIEGGRLNSEELAQTAKTGVLPKPFDGPLLSGAEDLSKSIGNNSASVAPSSVAPSFQPRMNAQLRAASLTQAYRFYNPRTTAHFFTTNTAERANIIATYPFMNDEGPAFFTSNAMVAGLSPVHRFYNTQTGVHFFTISEGERAKVAAELPQYIYEGIAYYASQLAGSGLTPLYRFFYASKSFHFFTSNIAERNNIIANFPNYTYEGVGYYVMNSDWQATDVLGTNAAPVANAGVDQYVVTGSAVTLDGSASSDANSDPLTYAWTLTSKPAGSTAVLSSTTSARPIFNADVAGTYVARLMVNDGKLSSGIGLNALTTITAGPAVLPLPVGAGTIAQDSPTTRFYNLNEETGLLNALPNACQIFSAADLRPDGVVVAVSSADSLLRTTDLLSGTCSTLFQMPEPMNAIAVAADGTIVTISAAKYFGARQIYRFTAAGALISKAAASGAGITGIGDFTSPGGIDFAPNGSLYAVQLGSIWLLDATTGSATLKAIGLAGGSDIDIDSAGTLRTIDFGVLKQISTATWAVTSSRTLERGLFGFSPLVRR